MLQLLLSFFSSLGGVAALLLLLVPVGRMSVNLPERVVMEVQCLKSELLYSMHQPYPCDNALAESVKTNIESCG